MNMTQQPSTSNNLINFNSTEIGKTIQNTASNIGNSIVETKDVIFDSINQFGNSALPSIKEASNDFLNANTMIAKFIFVILGVILFLVLFRIVVYFLNYYYSPKSKVVLVNGYIAGNSGVIIQQNPKSSTLNLITRSNDRVRGLEATWNLWLYIDGNDLTTTTSKHILNKGNNQFGSDGIATVNNAPGIYASMSSANDAKINVYFDTQTNNRRLFELDNIPMQKWFMLSILLKNNIIDIYVNGTISKRETVEEVFKQNFDTLNLGSNGGFNGKISNLTYFSYAISPFQMKNIYVLGPNLTESSLTAQKSTGENYLSTIWYFDRM